MWPSIRSGAILLAALALVSCRGEDRSVTEQAASTAVRGLERARRERSLERLEQLRTALTRYAIDHDGGVPEGSSLAGVSGELAPRYLPIVPAEDGWGQTMSYASDGRTYSIVSAGPDGETGTADDLTLRDGAVSAGS
jgi:hypothetical protein